MSDAPTTRGTPRKVLARYGRRGDQVIVKEDRRAGHVVVAYRDAEGVKRKKVYPLTRDGRVAACTWAETYHQTRTALAQRVTREPTTLRGLWDAYASSPAFQALRPKTQVNYRERFAKWERFLTREARPDDTSLFDVDRWISAARATGMALNQVRQVINVARTVYRWGETRDLITRNKLAIYRWKQPKDAAPLEPEEYTDAEWATLMRALDPEKWGTWRAWVALTLIGETGQRANAICHLRWCDVDEAAGTIIWPAEWQKQGKALARPLTPRVRAALRVARRWADRELVVRPPARERAPGGYFVRPDDAPEYRIATPWILFATRRPTEPYSYSSLHAALRAAEDRAGVKHLPFRAMHGGRKRVVGRIGELTGEPMMGLEYVGDVDPKMLRKYDRRMAARIDRAAAAIGGPTSTEAAGGGEESE